MPLDLPNLDDRRYNDLVAEALALIPAHAPEWTNHNPSDPGITLIEVFAYLTEMLIYRLNRVSEANQQAFLQLLTGKDPDWKYNEKKTLKQNIQDAVLRLREEQRAVTVEDFERLARTAMNNKNMRAYCLPRWDLDKKLNKEGEGHVSVVIVPKSDEHITKVKEYLKDRCLMTTRLHVVGPDYLKLRVQIRLKINPDALEATVRKTAIDALKQYFDPLLGGAKGSGWPLGQNVYISDIYALLDKLPGVDYVEKYQDKNKDPLEELIPGDAARRLTREGGNQLVGVQLKPYELFDYQFSENDIQIVRDIKYNRNR